MSRTSKRKLSPPWGTGTFYERKDVKEKSTARFRAQVPIAGKRESFSGRDYADVQAQVDARILEVRGGISQEFKEQTFSQFSQAWFDWYSVTGGKGKQGVRGLSESTKQGYRLHLRHLCEVIGDVKMMDLRASHIDQIVNKKGISNNMSVNIYDTYIRVEKYGHIKRAFPLGRPSESHWGRPAKDAPREITPFTEEQMVSILTTAQASGDEQLYLLMTTLFQTGMRINEALGLIWDDFELDADIPYFVVSHSLKANQFPIERSQTKNGKSRTIELGKALTKMFKEYQKSQRSRLITAVVFDNNAGKFRDSNNWTYRKWRHLLIESGIDPKMYSPHSTRHTYATVSLRNKQDIYNISERLGHADPSFTVKRYTHYQQGKHQEEANALDHLLPAQKAL